MPILSLVLAQVAAEYGALAARDAFVAVKQQVASLGVTEIAIVAAVVVGLYLLVKNL